jgi:hypothetical protein
MTGGAFAMTIERHREDLTFRHREASRFVIASPKNVAIQPAD